MHAQGGLASLYNNAQRHLQSGENDKAIEAFKQYLDIAKESKEPTILNTLDMIYYGLGSAYFNAGQYDHAAATLSELLQKFPNSKLVPEVRFFTAQAFFFQDDFARALEAFRITEQTPRYREESLLFQAETLRKSNKPSEAIEPLGKVVEGGVRSANTARAALQLAVTAAELQDAPKAIDMLTKISGNLRVLPNVASYNQAAILIGDAFLNGGKQNDALSVYRLIQSKPSVLALQQNQINILEKLVAARRRQAQAGSADKAPEILAEAARYQAMLEEIRKSRDEYEKAPDIHPSILLRLAKAFYESGRRWEAITCYDELLLRYPEDENRETAVYGQMVAYSDERQLKKSLELADRFVADFPNSPLAEEVRYLKGVSALENDDADTAIKALTDLLKEKPDTKYKEEAAYMIANARFGSGKYAEARADYETFIKAFPQSSLIPEIRYRLPLCLVFDGKYEEAIKELNDFITKGGDSPFIPDAKYRLMVCYFAAAVNDKTGKQYNTIISHTEQFQKQYPDSTMLGEVLALRGDSYAGLGELPGQPNMDDEAADAYLAGFRAAQNEESQNYNLFEAIKLWQRNGHWDKIYTTLTEFVAAQPGHPSIATAQYWIGRSLIKQRKEEEAKQYYAKEIRAQMSQPRKDGVEMMIRELTQVLGKKRRPAPPPPPQEGAEAATAPVVAEAPKLTPDEELDQLIGGEAALSNRTSTARLFLAKAQLAEMRNDAKTRDVYYEQLGEFEPSELSAYILGQLADFFVDRAAAAQQAGTAEASTAALDKADKFSKELLASFPNSEFLELGYVGQGEVAFARGNYQPAYQWFKDAVEAAGAAMKLKEAMFGQAKALLKLGSLTEAKTIFEQVASTREWRGALTPESIFNLGEIEFAQGRFKEANAFYQRVYAGYQRYPEACAKAYLGSARALEKLGLRKEASNTIGEMLRNDKMPSHARDEARKLLKEWGLD